MWIKAPACRWGGEVTQGGEKERTATSLREIGKESLIIIVTVSHSLATQLHHQSTLALGVWWVTLCRSFLPSIHPSLSDSSYTHTQAHFSLAVTHFICLLYAFLITALHHHCSCQSSHTGSSPRLWDVLFPMKAQSPSSYWKKDMSSSFSEE